MSEPKIRLSQISPSATGTDSISGNVTISNDLTVGGNLVVSGDTTTLNVETLLIEDNEIILNSNVASTPTLNAQITVNRGSSPNAFLLWDESADKWGWSDDGNNVTQFANALLKTGDTMTGELNVANNLVVTGNVGVGASNPTSTLHIRPFNSDTVADAFLVEQYNAAGTDRAIFAIKVDSSNNLTTFISSGTNAGGYNFLCGNDEKIRIGSDGRIGVGTSSPATLIDIQGTDEGIHTLRNGDNSFGSHVRIKKSRINSIVQNGDVLGSVTFEPYNGTSFFEHTGIRGIVNGTVSSGSIPVDLFFSAGVSGVTGDNERMRITSGGNVAIGTTTTTAKLTIAAALSQTSRALDIVASGSGNYQRGIRVLNSSMATNESIMGFSCGRSDSSRNQGQMVFNYVGEDSTSNFLEFGLFNVDKVLNITGAGRVGIGWTGPEEKLGVIDGTKDNIIRWGDGATCSGFLGANSGVPFIHSNNSKLGFGANSGNNYAEKAFINESLMQVNHNGAQSYGVALRLNQSAVGNSDGPKVEFYKPFASGGKSWTVGITVGVNDGTFIINEDGNSGTGFGTVRVSIAPGGAVTIPGSLSKGSGSFKIDHPLPEKSNTHHLVHSFIEGPQADLIYSGRAQLENGLATVNIDMHSNMTEGTFIALCRDIRCFTNNESDWDNVRGSVAGNILTIECQNPASNATISWMVIGERQDKHMYDTEWTDENGKVIVEPEKINIESTTI